MLGPAICNNCYVFMSMRYDAFGERSNPKTKFFCTFCKGYSYVHLLETNLTLDAIRDNEKFLNFVHGK